MATKDDVIRLIEFATAMQAALGGDPRDVRATCCELVKLRRITEKLGTAMCNRSLTEREKRKDIRTDARLAEIVKGFGSGWKLEQSGVGNITLHSPGKDSTQFGEGITVPGI